MISCLGIDIGTKRLRVAHLACEGGASRILAVASRELSSATAPSGEVPEVEYFAALIEEAVDELGTKERRSVCAVTEPHAILRSVRFPKISSDERLRAASFEARRFIDYPVEQATLRLHRIPMTDRHALGVVRTSVVNSRMSAIRAAGLKVVAVDHESCALSRAFRNYDGVVDIGYERVSLHVPSAGGVPLTLHARTGGADVTTSIARELAIDLKSAEKRKRILGTAGAGDAARARLATEIVRLISAGRNHSRQIAKLAFTGNGARLPRLLTAIESAAEVSCEIAIGSSLMHSHYPDDVIRSAAPDWTLAASLAAWNIA